MIASTQTNHPLVETKSGTMDLTPINQACGRLKAAGLRITQPRIAILTALIKRGCPTSIEQIHGDLTAEACDLVTVYRCLAAFEEIGLVRRSFYHNGTSLYAINLTEANTYHVVAKTGGQVEEIDPGITVELRRCVQQVEEQLRARGYSDVGHVVEFFGTAPQGGRVANQTAAPSVR